MNIIFNLIKKDFLIIKKVLLPIIIFTIVAPIFISIRTPEFQQSSNILYSILAFIITFMIYHTISLEEMKYKGEIYLKITPISMRKVVISKYIVILLTFIITTILYLITSSFPSTHMATLNIKNVVSMFGIICLFFGIHIPLTFKFGYVKLQLISAAIMFGLPFIIPYIIKNFSGNFTLINYFRSISVWNFSISIISISIFAIIIGIIIASYILENKEY